MAQIDPFVDICYRVLQGYIGDDDEYMFDKLVHVLIFGGLAWLMIPRILRGILQ